MTKQRKTNKKSAKVAESEPEVITEELVDSDDENDAQSEKAPVKKSKKPAKSTEARTSGNNEVALIKKINDALVKLEHARDVEFVTKVLIDGKTLPKPLKEIAEDLIKTHDPIFNGKTKVKTLQNDNLMKEHWSKFFFQKESLPYHNTIFSWVVEIVKERLDSCVLWMKQNRNAKVKKSKTFCLDVAEAHNRISFEVQYMKLVNDSKNHVRSVLSLDDSIRQFIFLLARNMTQPLNLSTQEQIDKDEKYDQVVKEMLSKRKIDATELEQFVPAFTERTKGTKHDRHKKLAQLAFQKWSDIKTTNLDKDVHDAETIAGIQKWKANKSNGDKTIFETMDQYTFMGLEQSKKKVFEDIDNRINKHIAGILYDKYNRQQRKKVIEKGHTSLDSKGVRKDATELLTTSVDAFRDVFGNKLFNQLSLGETHWFQRPKANQKIDSNWEKLKSKYKNSIVSFDLGLVNNHS